MATAEKPFIRQDGKDKVTGLGRYTADLTMTGMLQAKFRYADHAHARITRHRHLQGPGAAGRVRRDHARGRARRPLRPVRPGPAAVRQATWCATRASWSRRWRRSRPRSPSAPSTLIEVDYEPLEIVSDVEAALSPAHRCCTRTGPAYGASEDVVRDGNDCSRSTIVKGDVDKGMAEADIVVKERYVADMSHAVPIEPHAVVAQWQGDRVTIWSSTQVPFIARSGVATTLELPECHVRIIVPHLGGGFGGKCEFHYEAHVAALARAAERPVRLVFSRREEFLAPDHRREGQVIELETGVHARTARIVARRGRLILDNGAYSADAPFFPQLAAMMAVGPYRIPNVFDRRQPGLHEHDAVRLGARPHRAAGLLGASSSTWTRWPRRSGMDPVELRRRNIVKEGDEDRHPARCSSRSAPPRRWSGRSS